jgi:7,8-dihydropterin-6-yl-methyl-4-(beta-D-ribofuranosyl)aminobenzene 5'-phosphate synthase
MTQLSIEPDGIGCAPEGLPPEKRKLTVVPGGFHLHPMPPDYLIPMHCTGNVFYELAKQEMPGRVLLSATGTRFVFGA